MPDDLSLPRARGGLYFGQYVTSRHSPEPLHDARPVVADGALCPLHGLPTRLGWLPESNVRYSACAQCDTDFLQWYGAQPVGQRVSLRPPKPRALDLFDA